MNSKKGGTHSAKTLQLQNIVVPSLKSEFWLLDEEQNF